MFSWDTFYRLPVVGILRGFNWDQIRKLMPAAATGGLCNFEVTMNTDGAAEIIRLLCELAGDRANVGAGTVCSLASLEAALEAGAGFIVTPVVAGEVIAECVKRQVPVFPGAMSPTEIHLASQLGGTLVKVFPSDQLGPAYIKSLKAPFPNLRLMPTGGVTVETLTAYKRAGAEAFGVGSPLFDQRQIAAGNWDWVTQQARRFAEAYAAA
ncbi:MAG: bifunctional 4-hydroxy-2-oxoglutarate aldolase/2-dehydro-3-deoxy-phosphogluconate aldolase [Verrucomicrobiota bacterium]